MNSQGQKPTPHDPPQNPTLCRLFRHSKFGFSYFLYVLAWGFIFIKRASNQETTGTSVNTEVPGILSALLLSRSLTHSLLLSFPFQPQGVSYLFPWGLLHDTGQDRGQEWPYYLFLLEPGKTRFISKCSNTYQEKEEFLTALPQTNPLPTSPREPAPTIFPQNAARMHTRDFNWKNQQTLSSLRNTKIKRPREISKQEVMKLGGFLRSISMNFCLTG